MVSRQVAKHLSRASFVAATFFGFTQTLVWYLIHSKHQRETKASNAFYLGYVYPRYIKPHLKDEPEVDLNPSVDESQSIVQPEQFSLFRSLAEIFWNQVLNPSPKPTLILQFCSDQWDGGAGVGKHRGVLLPWESPKVGRSPPRVEPRRGSSQGETPRKPQVSAPQANPEWRKEQVLDRQSHSDLGSNSRKRARPSKYSSSQSNRNDRESRNKALANVAKGNVDTTDVPIKATETPPSPYRTKPKEPVRERLPYRHRLLEDDEEEDHYYPKKSIPYTSRPITLRDHTLPVKVRFGIDQFYRRTIRELEFLQSKAKRLEEEQTNESQLQASLRKIKCQRIREKYLSVIEASLRQRTPGEESLHLTNITPADLKGALDMEVIEKLCSTGMANEKACRMFLRRMAPSPAFERKEQTYEGVQKQGHFSYQGQHIRVVDRLLSYMDEQSWELGEAELPGLHRSFLSFCKQHREKIQARSREEFPEETENPDSREDFSRVVALFERIVNLESVRSKKLDIPLKECIPPKMFTAILSALTTSQKWELHPTVWKLRENLLKTPVPTDELLWAGGPDVLNFLEPYLLHPVDESDPGSQRLSSRELGFEEENMLVARVTSGFYTRFRTMNKDAPTRAFLEAAERLKWVLRHRYNEEFLWDAGLDTLVKVEGVPPGEIAEFVQELVQREIPISASSLRKALKGFTIKNQTKLRSYLQFLKSMVRTHKFVTTYHRAFVSQRYSFLLANHELVYALGDDGHILQNIRKRHGVMIQIVEEDARKGDSSNTHNIRDQSAMRCIRIWGSSEGCKGAKDEILALAGVDVSRVYATKTLPKDEVIRCLLEGLLNSEITSIIPEEVLTSKIRAVDAVNLFKEVFELDDNMMKELVVKTVDDMTYKFVPGTVKVLLAMYTTMPAHFDPEFPRRLLERLCSGHRGWETKVPEILRFLDNSEAFGHRLTVKEIKVAIEVLLHHGKLSECEYAVWKLTRQSPFALVRFAEEFLNNPRPASEKRRATAARIELESIIIKAVKACVKKSDQKLQAAERLQHGFHREIIERASENPEALTLEFWNDHPSAVGDIRPREEIVEDALLELMVANNILSVINITESLLAHPEQLGALMPSKNIIQVLSRFLANHGYMEDAVCLQLAYHDYPATKTHRDYPGTKLHQVTAKHLEVLLDPECKVNPYIPDYYCLRASEIGRKIARPAEILLAIKALRKRGVIFKPRLVSLISSSIAKAKIGEDTENLSLLELCKKHGFDWQDNGRLKIY